MVMRSLAALWLLTLLAAPATAIEVEPLKNGYSTVPPQTAALLQKGPKLSERMERGADDILSRQDGVSAAVAAALTATVTANPAVVLVGGLAGIWVGDQRIGYCGCKEMQLGEKVSSLFRTVSKTIFKGGRAFVSKSKELAHRAGQAVEDVRKSNDPMPLDGQSPAVTVVKKPEPLPIKVPVAAPKPVAVVKKTPLQPAVLHKAKKLKPLKKTVPKKQIVKSKPKPKKTTVARKKKKTKAAKKSKVKKPMGKKTVPKPKKILAKKPAEPLKKPIVRADSKTLHAMPKLAVAEELSMPEPKEDERPWPEQQVMPMEQKKLVHRVLKFDRPITTTAMKPQAAPPEAVEPSIAKVVDVGPGCDSDGSKFTRGRLAWVECYYRMGEM